ncbi:tRNA lysidine(34) synthetase TilS [Corynebacterium sp. 13CS0277]|uniref:tRNA lysidine(34) synthetase TilS n=1 Tax=Corynebacterium sp. 13CS0277 TaxID=2071994 RepID=UPI000D045443|nr:tRNA lysidine(34) synthetase TilS [Corynebacterium sp. 13CS0277]PRQ11543.1 tRNA lysidine(34) synthetase TilS [Corynebacterium sp. 13CS0277]
MPARLGDMDVAYDAPGLQACRRALRQHLAASATDDDTRAAGAGARGLRVGFSGGPDSFALLAAACAEELNPVAVIVDHGLHPEHAAITAAAAERAEALGAAVEIHAVGAAVAARRATGVGEEAAAREARYAAFAAAGCAIAVAHTADDQAETWLLGALRGHATGMQAVSRRGSLLIHRPLLGIRRADTHAVATELSYRGAPVELFSDPTNLDPTYRRGALRTQVLPALHDTVGSDPIPQLAAAAEQAAAADAAIGEWAAPLVRAALQPTADAGAGAPGMVGCAVAELPGRRAGLPEDFLVRAALDVAAVDPLPEVVCARVIRDIMVALGAAPTQAAVAAAVAQIRRWRGQGAVAVGRGSGGHSERLAVARIRGKLVFASPPRDMSRIPHV